MIGKPNLWIEKSSNVIVRNCTFQNNFYVNIDIVNECSKIWIEDNRFLNSDCGVITVGVPSSSLYIRHNYFNGADKSEPIAIYGLKPGIHTNIEITDNIIENHTIGNGILIRATDGIRV